MQTLGAVGWSQAAVLAFALGIGLASRTRLLARQPAVCHGLWLLVLLATAASPIVGIASALPSGRSRAGGNACARCMGGLPCDGCATTVSGSSPLVWALPATSGLVSCGLFAATLRQVLQARRLVRQAASGCDRARRLLGEAIHTLERPIAVDLKIVAAPCTPMLWAGCSPPAIVLPKLLVATLSDDALRGVLIHELAHLVRRDHWTNVLAFAATCLVWWHPLAWFARRQLADAAEACCDALAIERLPHLRRTYAETLLVVVDSLARTPEQPSALGVTFGRSQSLRRRFELIADRSVRPCVGRLGWSLLAGSAVVLLGVSALSFFSAATLAAPVQAQPPAANSSHREGPKIEIFTSCCPS